MNQHKLYQDTILEMESWEDIVIWFYQKFPHTIHSDNELQSSYEQLMNVRLDNTRANSFSRAGRRVRQKNPVKYCRDSPGFEIRESAFRNWSTQ